MTKATREEKTNENVPNEDFYYINRKGDKIYYDGKNLVIDFEQVPMEITCDDDKLPVTHKNV